jgi:hypothetical protein|tara:strand:- start:3674 stop:4714 length:1041 start_codon:yes stop_codon:yes gene_type:complete
MKSDVVKALLKPGSYDEEITAIKMIQTHISWVFLTGKYAYKVKKPVDFKFLDFTTLNKREHYCKEEIRVNKPLCGDMYVGVVPITKGREIKVCGNGEVIEYAVKMRELPQKFIMEKYLKKGEVNEIEIEKIADKLADFHLNANTGKGVNKYGSISQITRNWDQNFEQTKEMRGDIVASYKYDFIEKNVMSFILRNNDLFEERVKKDCIRECHGDVHSKNIFLLKESDEIYIFDAIEFNQEFSCSDVIAEIAFLAMDLDFHKKPNLANHLIKCYIAHTKDLELYKLLSFYKCYRAFVRAKVHGFKLSDATLSKKEKNLETKKIKEYYNLAFQYSKDLFQQQFNPYLF